MSDRCSNASMMASALVRRALGIYDNRRDKRCGSTHTFNSRYMYIKSKLTTVYMVRIIEKMEKGKLEFEGRLGMEIKCAQKRGRHRLRKPLLPF